jgi:hypothetical protein
MMGNALEWTRSLWGGTDPEGRGFGYPYDTNDSQREDLKAPDA